MVPNHSLSARRLARQNERCAPRWLGAICDRTDAQWLMGCRPNLGRGRGCPCAELGSAARQGGGRVSLRLDGRLFRAGSTFPKRRRWYWPRLAHVAGRRCSDRETPMRVGDMRGT